jgi:hypothetical protein
VTAGQRDVVRSNSPTSCWSSTNKVAFSTDMYGCIFSFFQCLIQFLRWLFFPKPATDSADHRWSVGHSYLTSAVVFFITWNLVWLVLTS